MDSVHLMEHKYILIRILFARDGWMDGSLNFRDPVQPMGTSFMGTDALCVIFDSTILYPYEEYSWSMGWGVHGSSSWTMGDALEDKLEINLFVLQVAMSTSRFWISVLWSY